MKKIKPPASGDSRDRHSRTSHGIITGDARDMKEAPDESVHLIVTSPPYWQLKDYGAAEQIGFNDNYEDYVNNLNLVWSECARTLREGCRLCVNIGDQFARSVYYGRYKVIPIRTEIIKFCETSGFDYMGAVIWRKPTTMNTTGGATVMGSFPYPRNGIIKIDYEFILVFRKPGGHQVVSNELKKKSQLSKKEWNEYFSGHWNFVGERQTGHIAMFPEELPRRLIKMFSFVGDTILDPFLGSGTTTLAALKLGRNSLGYEINPLFIPLIKQKIGADDLFPEADFEFLNQESATMDWGKKIEALPYRFRDPVKFDKKTDSGKMRFGSKIDSSKSTRETYHIIKEIIRPDLLVLNNGERIRLLGIKPDGEKLQAAMEFLSAKLKGQKVYLRFDGRKYDEEGNILCYLYMKNRTFINAHIIKNKLAEVDVDSDFRHKEKFIKLSQ